MDEALRQWHESELRRLGFEGDITPDALDEEAQRLSKRIADIEETIAAIEALRSMNP